MKGQLTKGDKVLIGMVILIGAVFFAWMMLQSFHKADQVVISKAGEPYGRYSLNEDQVIEIAGESETYNYLKIENGSVTMQEASCPDQVCVHHKAIHKNGETIVCLPNQLLIKIEGMADNSEDTAVPDGVTN